MLKTLWFIFYTELILLLRRSSEWIHPIGFFTIVVCFFPLALSPDKVFLQKIIPGSIWIAALFSSLLSIQPIFFADHEEGNIEQLLLSQIPLAFILLAKLIAHWLVTELPLVLLTPLFGVMFYLSSQTTYILTISLLIGTPIFTLVGCFCAALTFGLRHQGMMLGILMLPLLTPVLIFGVNIVQQFQGGLNISGALLFLTGLTMFAITVLPATIAGALRIAIDD